MAINKLWERCFQAIHLSYFSFTFCSLNFSIYQWILQEAIITMVVQWCFSISFIPSVFIIWDSSVRNICPCPRLFIYLIIYLYHHFMDFYIVICVMIQYPLSLFCPSVGHGSSCVFLIGLCLGRGHFFNFWHFKMLQSHFVFPGS